MNTRFVFVIDTDQYAGNFERDMCAYCTGHIGDCEVGDDYAKRYFDHETEAFENIEQRNDNDSCRRPCSIYPTPGTGHHNSVAIFFYEKPTAKQVELIKRRAGAFNEARKKLDKFARDEIAITGFRIVTVTEKSNSEPA